MTEVSPKIQNEIFTITESTRVETTNDIEEQVSKKSRSQLFPLKRKGNRFPVEGHIHEVFQPKFPIVLPH